MPNKTRELEEAPRGPDRHQRVCLLPPAVRRSAMASVIMLWSTGTRMLLLICTVLLLLTSRQVSLVWLYRAGGGE